MTGPSHTSLFTSRLPSQHGVQNNGDKLAAELVTLSESLAKAGRATGAFVSLAAMSHKYGLNAGFDVYADGETERYWWVPAASVNDAALPWVAAHAKAPFFAFVHYSDPHGPYLPPSDYQELRIGKDDEELAKVVVDGRRLYFRHTHPPGATAYTLTLHGERPIRCVNWMQTPGFRLAFGQGFRVRPHPGREPRPDDYILDPDRPATLIVHNEIAPAGPAPAKIRFDGILQQTDDEQRRGYDREIAYVDAELGRLLDLMDQHDLWGSTAFVLTSDHGEELGEVDGYFGHVERLREADIHVPMMIVAPGWFEAGKRVKEVVRQVDVLPTLAQVLGFGMPTGAIGASLFPSDAIGERIAIAQTYRPQAKADRMAAVGQHYKLTLRHGDKSPVLYDLRADPQENKPVRGRGEDPDEPRRLSSALRGVLDGPHAGPARIELDEEAKEALKALGYGE